MGGDLFGPHTSEVAEVTAIVERRVAVQDFLVESRPGNPNTVGKARNRREIQDKNEKVIGVFALAEKSDHRVLSIVTVNPFKTLGFCVALPQCPFPQVQVIEVPNVAVEFPVRFVIEKEPV